ncbi:hypothetical protein Lal_00039776 [Lupinus albus]|nr:hypothetical protein Lal_00039776 [Lupinus albus]
MASSSRTKIPRANTSSSKSNPLSLTRLLSNDDQRKVFEEHFHGRTFFTPKYGNDGNFEISKEEIEQCKERGFGETMKNSDILSAGYFKLEDRLLRYILSYVILPKFSNHSHISDMELQLIYAMKYNIKINWTQMIMQQMWIVRDSQSPLPYAIFITRILEHFGVSLDGETKVALNLHESKIDVEVVHKMGFSIDPIDRRTYRHRTDRSTAPTAQPEPTIPNPPEFHAKSSSSAAMP